jgi:hypothetical protein
MSDEEIEEWLQHRDVIESLKVKKPEVTSSNLILPTGLKP